MLIMLLLCVAHINGCSQDLIFSSFKGTIYKMMGQRKYQKYNPQFLENPIIGKLEWDKINVPSRSTELGFPDVSDKGNYAAFGILFETNMEVTSDFNYRFELNSDDGSILWIDDKEIINNDFSDGMHMRDDTLFLKKGSYDLKVWYFQAYPTEYGIIFNADTVNIVNSTNDMNVVLSDSILFDYDSFDLKEEAKSAIDSVISEIKFSRYTKCVIEGHTDLKGHSKYNLELSFKRAKSLKKYITNRYPNLSLHIECKGYGDKRPLSTVMTNEEQSKNRRVVLTFQ